MEPQESPKILLLVPEDASHLVALWVTNTNEVDNLGYQKYDGHHGVVYSL